MKRKELEKIEGLTKEQIDAIMDLHQIDETAHKVELGKKEDIIKQNKSSIDELNEKVKKFDGVDLDEMKAQLEDWQKKYDSGMAEKDKAFAKELLFRNYNFSSNMAKKAVMADFDEKELAFENGKFLGADDYFNSLKESDPTVFKAEVEPKRKTGLELGGTGGKEVDPLEAEFLKLNPDIKL